MASVVVIGGTGFIGTAVVADLVQHGHRVRSVSRRAPGQPLPDVEYVRLNIAQAVVPDDVLADAEVVVHLASATNPVSASHDPLADLRDNVEASVRLLDLCRRQQVRRVVYSSSGGTVYGPAVTTPIDEDHPTNPVTPYGIGKLVVERYLAYYQASYGLEYSAIRTANAYGPGQRTGRAQGIIGELLLACASGHDFTVWGDGSTVRDYVYIADVARAFRLAVEVPTTAGAYNVGTGLGVSVRELIGRVGSITGCEPQIRYVAAEPATVPTNVLSPARAEQALGWRPLVGLDDGLRLTWDLLRQPQVEG
jgi:UDP-glucose 4-epimerase